MTDSILYCGDTELNGAAAYLAGLMESAGWPYEYVPSHVPISAAKLDIPRSLIILSDYPASQFDLDCQQRALRQIKNGCGLLMIGGWESFHGCGGNWEHTVLSEALPVEIQTTDDRQNFDQSAWLLPDHEHDITTGLPWYSRPPAIGGMNRVVEKPAATVVLRAHSFAVSATNPPQMMSHASPLMTVSHQESLPALVVGQYGTGRTAAFMSDVAPHWVGGFVDWGLPRVIAQASRAPAIEVGCHYAQFWKQLLGWTGALSARQHQSGQANDL